MGAGLMERAAQDTIFLPPPARTVDAGGQKEPLEIGLLIVAFNSVLARIPPRPLVVTGRTWTLEDKLALIEERLQSGPAGLLELILESQDRLEAVVTFVARPELPRRALSRVGQKAHC